MVGNIRHAVIVPALILGVSSACAHRNVVVTSKNAYSYYYDKGNCPPELIKRFVDGDPIDKMGAALVMSYKDCKQAVPIILDDFRALNASYHCDDVPWSDNIQDGDVPRRCTIVWKGQTVPYVDYHDPLFEALSRLTGIGYFEPDKAWFAALDEWVAAHLDRRERGQP